MLGTKDLIEQAKASEANLKILEIVHAFVVHKPVFDVIMDTMKIMNSMKTIDPQSITNKPELFKFLTRNSKNEDTISRFISMMFEDRGVYEYFLNAYTAIETDGTSSMINYLSLNTKLADYLTANIDKFKLVYETYNQYLNTPPELRAKLANLKEQENARHVTFSQRQPLVLDKRDNEVVALSNAEKAFPGAKVYARNGKEIKWFHISDTIIVKSPEEQPEPKTTFTPCYDGSSLRRIPKPVKIGAEEPKLYPQGCSIS